MELNENTQVKLDLKTIAIIVAGALSVASTYFTLQSKIDDLNYKIENITGDEFVKKMELQLKDELVRSTIIQIEKSTEGLKEDILDNKDRIKEVENKVYKR